MHQPLPIDGEQLDLARVVAVARDGATASLTDAARARMAQSLAWVQDAAQGRLVADDGSTMAVYGVNTGYGSLARIRIAQDRIQALSWNLVRSHAAGVGKPVHAEVVRAMMLLRANALAKGASGCRPALVDTLLAMLAADVVPDVPEQGSCGSSGDLAPLAHLALVLFRGPDGHDEPSGAARIAGEHMTGAAAMAAAGLERLVPGPKEGLAITNGAQLTTALAALACWDAARLVSTAQIAAAMSWEAVRGVTRALHPGVHALRPYAGAIACAADLRRLLEGSELTDSMPDKVQDAYSIRCTPQILGAVRDGIRYSASQVNVELNAATDNPLILVDEPSANKAYSAGLFHGEPVGMAADHLKLALCELGTLAERRLYRLTTGTLSSRLPALLADDAVESLGMMGPQTTAAALVAHNRALAWPSTADSIPTCEDQEDVVAMSTSAARQAREIVVNTTSIVAIELLAAEAALRHRLEQAPGTRLGRGTTVALEVVQATVDGAGELPSDAIRALEHAIHEGRLLDAVQDAIGPLSQVLP